MDVKVITLPPSKEAAAMSTAQQPRTSLQTPFEDGQRLDQPTFHQLYATMPEGKWAELVGGVVHIMFPLFEGHGTGDSILSTWLVLYWGATPGVRCSTNVSTILGDDSEVQPDLQLRIREDRGGQTRVEGGYVVGAPELVVEIGDSSRLRDLGVKKDLYEKAGVLEYLFVGLEPQEIRWFVRRDGVFHENPVGVDGISRSQAFPGLWLDPKALFAEDPNGLIATLEQGLATEEHAAFVAELEARRMGA
jgi:Uma2 family endonuclease